MNVSAKLWSAMPNRVFVPGLSILTAGREASVGCTFHPYDDAELLWVASWFSHSASESPGIALLVDFLLFM